MQVGFLAFGHKHNFKKKIKCKFWCEMELINIISGYLIWNIWLYQFFKFHNQRIKIIIKELGEINIKKITHSQVCNYFFSSDQFSSVTQLCLTLCNHMDWSKPGFPVHHQLPELAQMHVHRVSDTIKPSHPPSSPSPPTFNLSQYQCLFKWVTTSHQVAKVL